MRIVVAPEARDELAAAVGYIAKDNPVAAARFIERIREVVTLLAEGGLDGPTTDAKPTGSTSSASTTNRGARSEDAYQASPSVL